MSVQSAQGGARDRDRGDRLEDMVERMADNHVALQDAVTWALSEALAWRDKMPRTRENNTYPNGRQDGVDATVSIVRAALSAHLRGEDPRLAATEGDRQ